MKKSKRVVTTTRLLALLAALMATQAVASKPLPRPDEEVVSQKPAPRVQIALLLDNSGSMSGLLNQARTQLWKVVNEFATAKQNGRPLRVEIALYEYGESVRQLTPMTSNLDLVSEKLFGLGIRGGDEYCGQVIQSAVTELEWSGNPDDLKLIYIAGNEPFTQGPVHYEKAIAAAKKKGITVNTIHCGGDDQSWRAGAMAAAGSYLMINQNAQVAQVVAPQDAEINRLGAALNKTYIGYGRGGEEAKMRQEKMDESARSAAPAAIAERNAAKASVQYKNSDWDLVDATKDGKVDLGKLADDQLPAELKGKSKTEREAIVKAKEAERAEIQSKIAKLNEDRKKFLAKEAEKSGEKDTLDAAMTESIHTHGAAKSYSFE